MSEGGKLAYSIEITCAACGAWAWAYLGLFRCRVAGGGQGDLSAWLAPASKPLGELADFL